jgi:hypothetical protein
MFVFAWHTHFGIEMNVACIFGSSSTTSGIGAHRNIADLG